MTEPAVTVQAVHVSDGSNLPITRVVIHATSPGDKAVGTYVPYPRASAAGMARSTANYFTSQSSGGSAHYVVDVGSEEHCVSDDRIAWHAPPNPGSIGVEICGQTDYTREQWLAADVWPAVQRAADRVRTLCDDHDLPIVKLSSTDLLINRSGICGHVDVSNAFRQSDHTDPGPGFPWSEFIKAVAGPSLQEALMLYPHALDSKTGGHWFCNPADGSIYAFDKNGAPTGRFLGGLNGHPDWSAGDADTPVVGFCEWLGDGNDTNGNGYAIVCRDLGKGSHDNPAGDFHWYRFTGDGKYAR